MKGNRQQRTQTVINIKDNSRNSQMFEYDISFWAAFTAGVISFISPCVLPLVPPYLAYIAGVNMQELTRQATPSANGTTTLGAGGSGAAGSVISWRVAFIALVFVAGFSTVFVAMGASASAIGQLLREYMDILSKVAGVIIIIMGLHFLGVFRLPFLLREYRLNVNAKPATLLGAYVMGLAFALGWTPCIGPVLAAILAMAAQEESVAQGAALLSVYSAGLGIPFLLAAALLGPFMGAMKRFRRYMGVVEKVMGGFLVLTGIMFLTGTIQRLSVWLLETFPALANVG